MRVVTAPTVEPVSLDMARRQCSLDAEGGPPPTHPDDPLLSLYISAAREWTESFLGQTVAVTTVASDFDAFDSDPMALETGPVVAITSVTYLDSAGATQTVPTTVYALDTRQIPAVVKLLSGQAWPAPSTTVSPSVTITYQVGYTPDTVPKSIVAAILLTVADKYRNREDSSSDGLQAVPMGARSLLYPLMTRLGFA